MIIFLISLLYYAGFESSIYQATPGMQQVGIKVTDLKGHRISFRRAVARNILEMVFGMGYLNLIFSDKKQQLYDVIARTVVIHESFPEDGFDYLF